MNKTRTICSPVQECWNVKPKITKEASERSVLSVVMIAKYERDHKLQDARIIITAKELPSYTGTQIKKTKRSAAINLFSGSVSHFFC